MRRILVLTNCGTSLLTAGAGPDQRRQLIGFANHRPVDLTPADRDLLAQRVDDARQGLAAWPERSAELSALRALGLADGSGAEVQHLLVHTDTAQGEATASILHEWLGDRGGQARLLTAAGLAAGDATAFRMAVAALSASLIEEVPLWRASGFEVIFNLTGGFKSVAGFLQSLGTILADRVVYLFEGSNVLIDIPKLPVRFDPAGAMADQAVLFRKLSAGYVLDREAAAGVPETLLFEHEDKVMLSELGALSMAAFERAVLGLELQAPLSPKLVYGPRLVRDARGLPPDRFILLNRRLDRLGAYLDGVNANPASLNFKPLAGNPVEGSTHECYAWSDRDAARLFGHFEDGKYTVDRLLPHL